LGTKGGLSIIRCKVKESLDRLEHKNILQMLMLVSLGVAVVAKRQYSKWLKILFIVSDSLLIVNTIMEMIQLIKDKR
jgi:hypothetical protein